MTKPDESPLQAPASHGDLRLCADLLDEAQARRVALGERLRSTNRARASEGDTPDPEGHARHADAVSSDDRALDAAYADAVEREHALEATFARAVLTHPVWPWLSAQRGIGPLLAGRLLARLDVHRAPTPSSFWAYCGLSTVPGVRYLCAACGLDVTLPQGFRVQNAHRTRGTDRFCSGTLAPAAVQEGVRAAPRRPVKGESPGFDARARKFCYLIGVSFLRVAGEYRDYYDEQRVAIAASHPGWPRARIHMSALRKTEKLFLKNLWLAWRTIEGLPIVPPYRAEHDVAEVA